MGSLRHIVTDAIILKTSIINETNKQFVFISPDIGVHRAIAFGAANIKNRFCSSISACIKAKLFLYKSPKFDYFKLEDITDVKIHDSFVKDLKNIYLFSFMSEILQNTFVNDDEYKNYYYLLLYALELINENRHQSAFLFFTAKFFFLSGYNYNLSKCMECASASDNYYFDEKSGGIFCPAHSKSASFGLSAESAEAWKNFFEKKYTELKSYNVSKNSFNEIFFITTSLIKNIFEKNIKTSVFLKEIF